MKLKTTQKGFYTHPTAIVEPGARIGDGARIWAYAHVQKDAVIGAETNIGNYVFVENGVRLGRQVTVKNGVQLWEGVTAENGVFIGPGCVFTNDRLPRAFRKLPKSQWLKKTRLKEGCTLGAGSVLLCGIEIGRYAFVAAGALVTKSIPAFALVTGTPARFHSWRCTCGDELIFKKTKAHCSKCRKDFVERGGRLRAL